MQYFQLLTNISEFILKILIHEKTDINSVIINVNILKIIIVSAFNTLIFNIKIDNINTIG